MKGLKIIRTSNWDAMTHFFGDRLGMRERDHDRKDSLREFADFGTEVHLERVSSSTEHELCGGLGNVPLREEGLADRAQICCRQGGVDAVRS